MNVLVTGVIARNIDGTFKRIRKPFSLENFNDGYVGSDNRFRVWYPDHSRAYDEGYVLRSIVAYEFYHGITVPKDMDIHHKDRDRLNDSKENLEMMPHRKHAALHCRGKDPTAHIERICKCCGRPFKIERWRLKDKTRGRYCSQECYHKQRSEAHRKNISEGLKRAYREGRRR